MMVSASQASSGSSNSLSGLITGVSGRTGLSGAIHDIVDSYLENTDSSPSQLEILKISVLAVRQIHGKNGATQIERIRTSAAIARWIRTFNVLSYVYFSSLPAVEYSSDLREEARNLALQVYGYKDIITCKAQAARIFSQVQIPEYFYLMLWVAAGGRSWIPRTYASELVRIATMPQSQRRLIYDYGKRVVQEYIHLDTPPRERRHRCSPPEYNTVEASTEDVLYVLDQSTGEYIATGPGLNQVMLHLFFELYHVLTSPHRLSP